MFFRLKDKVLFRHYGDYGYITDNSMFGYRFLNDKSIPLKEKFTSQSGAYILSTLSRTPQELDAVTKKLFEMFIDVDYEVLRQDVSDFFMRLADEGYIACGETFDECREGKGKIFTVSDGSDSSGSDTNFSAPETNILKSIHIEIANACNERCLHCFIPNKYKTNFMPSDLFYKIVEDGRAMNIIHVTLTGGEPMLHPDFVNFLIKCRELDLSVNVLSNLTLLNDEVIAEMKKNPLLSVQASLYSMIPSVHDEITQLAGSFEKTRSGILRLVEAGIPVQISCQVMKQNKDSFAEVVRWGNEHNIPAAFNYMIFGEYDRTNENLRNRLSVGEVSEAFDTQISADYAKALKAEADSKILLGTDTPVCSVCRYYFGVTAEGDAFPCAGWQSKKLGSLREMSIADIWEKSPDVEYLRQIKLKDFPKCVDCADRGYCTICMMSSSNENPDGDIFRPSSFQCEAAAMVHAKVNELVKGD